MSYIYRCTAKDFKFGDSKEQTLAQAILQNTRLIRVSIVIPTHNNVETVTFVLSELRTALVKVDAIPKFYLVDDKSSDGTTELIRDKLSCENDVLPVYLAKRVGQVGAIVVGLKKCEQHNPIIVTSADGQDSAESVARLIVVWKERQVDMVIAKRNKDSQVNLNNFHRIVSFFYHRYPTSGFDMVLVSRVLVDKLLSGKPIRFLQIDMLLEARSVSYIDYAKQNRLAGHSQWSLKSRILYALTFIFYYTLVIDLIVLGLLSLLFSISLLY